MKKIFYLLAGGTLGLTTAHAQDTAKAPNIIYILADDLGINDLGCYGQQKIKTPAIDQMASEGMRFTHHYSGAAVSAPSRCTLLTGLHTGHCQVRGLPNFSASGKPVDMDDNTRTIAHLLSERGYQTAIIGKWGLAEGDMHSMPLHRGFDYFFGYKTHVDAHHYYPEYLWRNNEKVMLPGNKPQQRKGQYSNDLFTQDAVKYIRDHQEQPFFLFLSYSVPHFEMTVPEDSKQQYKGLKWPKRRLPNGHYFNDEDGNTAYAGMVSRLDRYVAQIIQTLKDLGMDENTIVCFASDNGPEYDNGFFKSNAPYRGRKRDLYEGGVRAPFIVRWPGKVAPGSTSDHISAFWDFMPTACEIAGKRLKEKTDGISFLPTLLGKKQKVHKYLYWETNMKQGPIQAIRMGKWKAVKFLNKEIELYDILADPSEKKNVAAQHPAEIKKIKKILKKSRTEHPEYPLDRWVYKK